MQREMNFLRWTPASFRSSAPNLHVSIFCFGVTAKEDAVGKTTIKIPAMTA